jgi:hypothetical protein
MLVTSPAVLATTYTVDDGGGGYYGDGGGDGWATSCCAWANADGDWPSSGAVYWGSVDVYTDTAGWFTCSYNCSALGSASYTDFDGSGASGSGGGTGVTPGGSASAGISLSSSGPNTGDADSDFDPGCAGRFSIHLDAFGGVSAECACGAYASVGNSNMASGLGYANADVSL